MSTKRLRVLALVGLLLLGLLAVVFYLAGGAGRSTIVFPDGTRLTVVGTSRGGESFTTEKGWQKALRKLLPKRWQGYLPQPLSNPAWGNTNTMKVWFTLKGGSMANAQALTSPTNVVQAWMRPTPFRYCISVANDGANFPAEGVVYHGMSSGPRRYLDRSYFVVSGRLELHYVYCETFPRGQGEFDLGVSGHEPHCARPRPRAQPVPMKVLHPTVPQTPTFLRKIARSFVRISTSSPDHSKITWGGQAGKNSAT